VGIVVQTKESRRKAALYNVISSASLTIRSGNFLSIASKRLELINLSSGYFYLFA
jgi:hypothetical protein